MPEPPARSAHLTWVDTAKGIGIILVVLGHEISGLVDSGILTWTSTAHFFYTWIYAFHMPLFFVLAGCFIFRSVRKPWQEFVLEKCRTVAYPYFVWSTLTLTTKTISGASANHQYDLTDFPRIFYVPIDQFWFLYVLFVLLMIMETMLRIGVNRWIILGIALLLDPALLPIQFPPSPPLIQTGLFGVYLALGVVVGSERNIQTVSQLRTPVLLSGLVAGSAVSAFSGWPGLPDWLLLHMIFAISGMIAVVSLALLISNAKLDAIVQLLGRRSLEIYVAHSLAAAGARTALAKIAHVTAPTPHFVLGGLAGICFPVVLAIGCEAIGLKWIFRLPSGKVKQSLQRPGLQTYET